jgi:hypothetical protein
VESRHPYGFTIDANGDFEGRGVWTFAQHAGLVHVTFDWRIRAARFQSQARATVPGAVHRRNDDPINTSITRRQLSSSTPQRRDACNTVSRSPGISRNSERIRPTSSFITHLLADVESKMQSSQRDSRPNPPNRV